MAKHTWFSWKDIEKGISVDGDEREEAVKILPKIIS
jgi:hypothetical protein